MRSCKLCGTKMQHGSFSKTLFAKTLLLLVTQRCLPAQVPTPSSGHSMLSLPHLLACSCPTRVAVNMRLEMMDSGSGGQGWVLWRVQASSEQCLMMLFYPIFHRILLVHCSSPNCWVILEVEICWRMDLASYIQILKDLC